MDRRSEFLESINIKNNLKYRYGTLDRKIQEYINETLEKNNINKIKNMTLLEKLSCIAYIYPQKKDVITEILDMYYSDIILTENSYSALEELYNQLKEDVK